MEVVKPHWHQKVTKGAAEKCADSRPLAWILICSRSLLCFLRKTEITPPLMAITSSHKYRKQTVRAAAVRLVEIEVLFKLILIQLSPTPKTSESPKIRGGKERGHRLSVESGEGEREEGREKGELDLKSLQKCLLERRKLGEGLSKSLEVG